MFHAFHVYLIFLPIQVFVIGNSEVESVLSGQHFLKMTLHRKEQSMVKTFNGPQCDKKFGLFIRFFRFLY